MSPMNETTDDKSRLEALYQELDRLLLQHSEKRCRYNLYGNAVLLLLSARYNSHLLMKVSSIPFLLEVVAILQYFSSRG